MKNKLLKTKQDNDILEMLFHLRFEEIEVTTEENVIRESDFKTIKQVDLNNQIKALANVSEKDKEMIMNNLDILLDNRDTMNVYQCKKYYMAGINDALNIIFNEESEIIKSIKNKES